MHIKNMSNSSVSQQAFRKYRELMKYSYDSLSELPESKEELLNLKNGLVRIEVTKELLSENRLRILVKSSASPSTSKYVEVETHQIVGFIISPKGNIEKNSEEIYSKYA